LAAKYRLDGGDVMSGPIRWPLSGNADQWVPLPA